VDRGVQGVGAAADPRVGGLGRLSPSRWHGGQYGGRTAEPGSRVLSSRQVEPGHGRSGQDHGAGTQQACLVLMADRVYGFAYASGTRGKATVGEQLGAWPRSDVRVTTKPGRLTTRVELDIATTGEHYELECMTTAGNAGTSQLFLQELPAVPRDAQATEGGPGVSSSGRRGTPVALGPSLRPGGEPPRRARATGWTRPRCRGHPGRARRPPG
jgi:hypothetical protein